MLILFLIFIFSRFFSFIFLGQIWSQNLTFFKFTEIWNRGRLPYAHFDFNVCFVKILFHSSFSGKFSLKILSSSDWMKFGTEVDYHMLISILIFLFWKFFSFIFWGKFWSPNRRFQCLFFQNSFQSYFWDKFGPKIWSSSDWLKFGIGVDYHMLISTLMFIFSKFFSLIFSDKFALKIRSSSDWLKFGTEVDYHMLISILIFVFSRFFSFIFLGPIWSQNLKFFKFTEILNRGRLPYTHFDFNI